MSDNLATAIQKETLSAAQGKEMAEATVNVLKDLRTELAFNTLYNDVLSQKERLGRFISTGSINGCEILMMNNLLV